MKDPRKRGGFFVPSFRLSGIFSGFRVIRYFTNFGRIW